MAIKKMQVYDYSSVHVNDVKKVHKQFFVAKDQNSVIYDEKIVMIM